MLGKKEQQPERDLINDQLEREYADATEANRQALCDEIERLTAESRVVSDELKRVDDARSPAIELRHKRETAASAERDRRNAERELAREHEEQSKLAAQIEQHEQHIPRLEHELQQVPYDEALHQKLIGLLPLAQQLERAERDQCAKVQDKAEKSRDLSEAEKKLQAAKRKYDDAAEKHSIAEQAHVAAKEKFSALREKYGSVDMVNHVAGEIERLGAIEEQLGRDQEEFSSLEKRQILSEGATRSCRCPSGVSWASAPNTSRKTSSSARTSKQIKDLKDKAQQILGKQTGADAHTKLSRIAAELIAAESLCASTEKAAKKAAETAAEMRDGIANFERNTAVLKREIQSLSEQIGAAASEIDRLRREIGDAGDVKTIQLDLDAQRRAKQQRTQIEGKTSERRRELEEGQDSSTGKNSRGRSIRSWTDRDRVKREAEWTGIAGWE
jgi:chromosome segregation ATPase